MSEQKWNLELSEYIREGEPDRVTKSAAWRTAIGLQDVDGLTTSDYLLSTAKEHIEGHIDMADVQRRIQSYYEESAERKVDTSTREADIVSARITELLSEQSFTFSPVELQNIHKRLFSGVFNHAGEWRTFNITKKEWVLKGNTVIYGSAASIYDTLVFDFREEKKFEYKGISVPDAVKHIAKFIAGLWQIHPFAEGNTRTTAVFLIKYLQSFGFKVNNDVFAANAWYFRNALVRANYNDLQKNINATPLFLERFLENLLAGTKHELKNRYLHLDFQSATNLIPKGKICTLNCTLEELAVIRCVENNPKITQKTIATEIGRSERTVKNIMSALQKKGYLERENGRRNGCWKIKTSEKLCFLL